MNKKLQPYFWQYSNETQEALASISKNHPRLYAFCIVGIWFNNNAQLSPRIASTIREDIKHEKL